MAKIDIDKFVASMIAFLKNENYLWKHLQHSLNEQGLEYKDGEIVEIALDIEPEKWYECIANGLARHTVFKGKFLLANFPAQLLTARDFRPLTEDEENRIKFASKHKEQAESEKIRKEIIEHLRHSAHNIPAEKFNSWIAWLEKQGEQKCFEMKSAEESLGISSEEYNQIVDECIFGEQKSVGSDDEKVRKQIVAFVKSRGSQITQSKTDAWLAWLKKQKPVEWSEKDEEIRNALIKYLGSSDALSVDLALAKSWLKSLCPQKQWKPTKMQLECLKDACDEHFDLDGLDPLYTLYEQLKTL